MPTLPEGEARTRLVTAPVVRLATADETGRPHLVTTTFAVDGDQLYGAVDHKPKRSRDLRRLRNIRANPQVKVVYKGQPEQTMTAREADDAERAELWPKVIEVGKQYAGYQRKTERQIPLVLLESDDQPEQKAE